MGKVSEYFINVPQGDVTLCNVLSNLSLNTVATQVAEELHGVTCYLCNLSRNIFVSRSIARSRLSSTFCNDCSNFQSPLHSVTPLQQLVSQCFARSANQDPYYPLLSPPWLQFCELLFMQLQCYT